MSSVCQGLLSQELLDRPPMWLTWCSGPPSTYIENEKRAAMLSVFSPGVVAAPPYISTTMGKKLIEGL